MDGMSDTDGNTIGCNGGCTAIVDTGNFFAIRLRSLFLLE